MLSAELDMRNIADHALIFDCDGVLQRRIYSIKELFEQANFLHSQTLQSEFQQVEAAYLTKPDFDSAIRSWTGERRISEIQTSQLLAGYISVTIFSDILELIQDLGGDDTVIGIATDLTDFRAKNVLRHYTIAPPEMRFVSSELGLTKSNPEFFMTIQQQKGLVALMGNSRYRPILGPCPSL